MTYTTHHSDALKPKGVSLLTYTLFVLIGIIASFAFFLVLYWGLRLNSSIGMLILSTRPVYLWWYAVLTIVAVVLFGINAALMAYRIRTWGVPKFRSNIKEQGATGFGSLVAFAASSCPMCGSTVLAALGIAGGLAAFPLGGLELKALSVALLALPTWLLLRDMRKLKRQCDEGTCPAPKDPAFKEKDRPLLPALLGLLILLGALGLNMLKTDPAVAKLVANTQLNPNFSTVKTVDAAAGDTKLFTEVSAKVLPAKGFQSKIALNDSVLRLVEKGVIDKDKFDELYKAQGGLPEELNNVLSAPSAKPILLTAANANYYINVLWPLGLSNKMTANDKSPIAGKDINNFASTGGWTLGKEQNGGAYFNKFSIVPLTPEQEALVVKVAENSYRPCCNNSTFFQDCNHGSALLGLLELGASQGLSEDDLYREALAFNSFWFPQTYIETALYFKAVKNVDWENVDPKVIMGKDYSSITGWSGTVAKKVAELNLVPKQQGGAGCGV